LRDPPQTPLSQAAATSGNGVKFEYQALRCSFVEGLPRVVKTESFSWFALIVLCASSALDVPMFAAGFILIGRHAWSTTGARETILLASLCAAQFLGASFGFALAERVAFRDKKRDHLAIASSLTFLVAFLGGSLSGLMFDLAAMERFPMFRWSTNTIAISTFILLPVTGVVGLVYERRLARTV